MLKKTITYTDYNGDTRTEDFYFNLKKSEILDINFNANLKLSEQIQALIQAKDMKELYNLFKEIVLMAYGIKSEDGKHFRKSKEISEEFESTEAYSELMMELFSDEEGSAAAKFLEGIIPKEVVLGDKKNLSIV